MTCIHREGLVGRVGLEPTARDFAGRGLIQLNYVRPSDRVRPRGVEVGVR